MRFAERKLNSRITARGFRAACVALFCSIVIFSFITHSFAERLREAYQSQQSITIKDRNGEIIRIQPNSKGFYSQSSEFIPERFKELLIQKEDRFFYYHFGINPFSIARDISQYLFSGARGGSSTLTQQLVKILLGNERERTLKNKALEALYALSIEWHSTKNEILTLYANSAYFGNQTEGIKEASLFYFNTPPELLDDTQILELLITLNNPSERYPGTFLNKKMASSLADIFDIQLNTPETKISAGDKESSLRRRSKTSFEIRSLGIACSRDCALTVDKNLTESLREILIRNLSLPSFASVDNGAVVILKLPENDIIAVVGSPDPFSSNAGYQLNMAKEPRPIGSTAKPFIYLKAFEKGARPYSQVEDREYKYEIEGGFLFTQKIMTDNTGERSRFTRLFPTV